MRPTTGSLVVAPGRARRRVARRARAERRRIPQSRHARVASHAGNPGLYIHRSPNGSSLGAPPPLPPHGSFQRKNACGYRGPRHVSRDCTLPGDFLFRLTLLVRLLPRHD